MGISKLLLVTILFLTTVTGHTWLDCAKARVTDGWPKTVLGCEGYIRGYPGRLPGVNTDILSTYLITARNNGAPACYPGRQDGPNYSGQFPQGSARAGETLYFAYTENGHITKDKPANPKTYSVYWAPQGQIRTRGDLTPNRLLKPPTAFDDGSCGEDTLPPLRRSGKPCIGSYTIPAGTPSGQYQFVWFWQFDANPVGQEYTSCWDLKIEGGAGGIPQPEQPPRNDPPPQPPRNDPPPQSGGDHCGACTANANPNFSTGVSFQYYSDECKQRGGLGCIGNTGCRLCTTQPGRNPGQVPCPRCVFDHHRI